MNRTDFINSSKLVDIIKLFTGNTKICTDTHIDNEYFVYNT